ncbi:MAG: zinc-ribbon domain-containing protein [Promethearchaeia archaeon]
MLQYYDYFGTMIIFYILIIVGCCVVNVAIGAWIYKDAKKRNMDNPELWLIIVLVGGCIGCIVYLIVREPKPKDQVNPNITAPTNQMPIQQPANQESLQAQTSHIRYCPQCGSKLEGNTKFCNQCGYEL